MPPYNASSERKIKELTTFVEDDEGDSDKFDSIASKLVEAREILRKDFKGGYIPSGTYTRIESEMDRIQAKMEMYEHVVGAYETFARKLIHHITNRDTKEEEVKEEAKAELHRALNRLKDA